SSVLAVLALSAVSFAVLSGRPTLELARRGVVVRDPFGTRVFRWAALRGEMPVEVPTDRADPDTVTMGIDESRIRRIGFTARSPRLSLERFGVEPPTLVDAISYYVEHPEERAHIGTSAGYDRLAHAVAGLPALAAAS